MNGSRVWKGSEKGIWTGKKHYALSVWNNEGVQFSEPYLKVKGIEAVRSSTPAVVRDYIKDTLKLIMSTSESNVQQHIKKLKEQFRELPPEDVAFPRGVNGVDKYRSVTHTYEKGTPIAVRGALLYNKQINDRKLDNQYELVYAGGKIKYTYLKVPNPSHEDVIAFPDVLPPEFELGQYVDYDKQFEKSFIKPIGKILTAIGWTVEPRISVTELLRNARRV